jgi:cell division protein FtsW (lipid II flippase)
MAFAYSNSGPSFASRAIGALGSLARAWPAFLTVGASLALSLLGIYAIDVAESLTPHASILQLSPAAARQCLYLAVALVVTAISVVPPYRYLGYMSWALMALAIAFLIVLIVPGVPASIVRPRNGARAWIDFGFADFQPSELAKIAYVLVLAWYLRFSRNHRTFAGLIPPAIITFIPVGLIMLQPDLGTVLLFIPALFAMLVAAGAKLKHLVLIVALATCAAPAGYLILRPHQKQRIDGLILQLKGDTSADQDINMQSVTSQRLAGAGGYAGVGDEHSRTLLHFNALPERKTDMIFAVVVNRFGVLGGLFTLSLYGVWVVGALMTAAVCREPFGRIVCVGMTGFIIAQVFVNAGMNLGIVPIIGITLPYVSHGGSSLLVVWIMTGLIFNVALRRPRTALRKSFEYDDVDD